MAFDPHKEDYERLGLRFARSLDGQDLSFTSRSFASFGRRYSQNRDSLPQTDEDRAFHLVAQATTLIDYELPFADENRAAELIGRGYALLEEALTLNPHCHDAMRMLAAAEYQSFDGYYNFLCKGLDSVRSQCEEACAQVSDEASPERAKAEAELLMRPYYRWLANLAEKAVICGRNKEAIRVSLQLLELDPQDSADVRFTCALAYAKLEDEQGLEQLAEKTHALDAGATQNAWMQLSLLSLAHRQHKMDVARNLLAALLKSYPCAEDALMWQKELPDGVFSRLVVAPYSEDELILAVSEATTLLQEGRDDSGRGVLGSWLARELERAGGARRHTQAIRGV